MGKYKDAKNLNELFNNMTDVVRDSMEDVADVAKVYEEEAVEEVVYGGYTAQNPYHERRGSMGGLADRRNMIHSVTNTVNGIELFVNNVTRGNQNVYKTHDTYAPNYLTGIIINGRDRGRYMENRTGTQDQYLDGRDFLSAAVRNMERDLAHIDELRKSLRRKGINTD